MGYEVKCSRTAAQTLGAVIDRVYEGRNKFHWNDGWLWWIASS